MVKVLLIDDNDDTLLVECDDMAGAEGVGSAAIWSDGSVSAYVVPASGVPASQKLIEALRDGENVAGVREALS